MKYPLLLLLSIVLLSCTKEESQNENKSVACTESEYGMPVTLSIGEVICFPDGNSITFTTAAGEFCPCEAVCVWQGQLSILLETENSSGEKELLDFGSESYKKSNQIFESKKISDLSYDFNDPNVQDCMNEYDLEKISITLIIQ